MNDPQDGRFRFGVDYYPEHWPESRWAEDARLMRDAGLNVARVGEFAWSRLEPRPGEYALGWLERAIETLAADGIDTILGTPTAAPPPWLTTQHPEVLQCDERRLVRHAGSRRHYCANSTVYRDHTRAIVRALGERFGQNPHVVGWQIDNEFGCHGTARCYCDSCLAAWRVWLKGRYGSLDALGDAWGLSFWSQDFSHWEEVPLPWAAPAEHNPGLLLDFRRFSSESWVEYATRQIELLRELSPGRFITHNLMGFAHDLDYFELSRPLDFVSWDNYHFQGATPAFVAAAHDLMRGMKARPFWVIEQQAGQINWSTYNPAFRPGEARLKTLQAVAHGADGILYFRWRASRFGSEVYHSGLLDHTARPTRALAEVRQTAVELRALEPLLRGTVPVAQVAIFYSHAERWMLELQPHSADLAGSGSLDPYTLAPHRALYVRNVNVDFVEPGADLSPYSLVIGGAMQFVDGRASRQLEAWVRAGGTLVLLPRTGARQADGTMHDFPAPGPVAGLGGVTVAEFDAPPPEAHNRVRFSVPALEGREAVAGPWREVLTPESATVVARYTADFYEGQPAITVAERGTGRTVYCGVLGSDDLWEILFDWLLPVASVTPGPVTPAGVEAVDRRGAGGVRVLFLMNHTAEPARLALDSGLADAVTGTPVGDEVVLGPWDVLVLREDRRGG